MARFPLVLSASIPARSAGAEKGERAAGPLSCHFCTLDAGPNPATLTVAEASAKPGSVTACPLCALSHQLGEDTIDQDATLIWLPEMSQGVLNLLVRHIHMVCAAHGDSHRLSDVARPAASARVRAARISYRALQDRSAAAASRLGTASPNLLGVALLQFTAADYERRHALLAGARLLPAGRLSRGGEDSYPGLLHSWTANTSLIEEARR